MLLITDTYELIYTAPPGPLAELFTNRLWSIIMDPLLFSWYSAPPFVFATLLKKWLPTIDTLLSLMCTAPPLEAMLFQNWHCVIGRLLDEVNIAPPNCTAVLSTNWHWLTDELADDWILIAPPWPSLRLLLINVVLTIWEFAWLQSIAPPFLAVLFINTEFSTNMFVDGPETAPPV